MVLFCSWKKTFYVPSFSRNLILVSIRVPLWISYNFKDTDFTLLIKSKVIRYGIFFAMVFILYSCKIIMLITH